MFDDLAILHQKPQIYKTNKQAILDYIANADHLNSKAV